MPSFLSPTIWLIIGYLFGSIPFAVIIARARGVDIFKCGSGNPGATNVMRSVGKNEGRLCFLLDALKGFVPVLLAMLITKDSGFACAALVGSLLGHSFSFWIKFRGGKGVATTVGGLLALVPLVMFTGLLIWVAVFFASRYVSLASIVMAFWLPFGAYLFHSSFSSLIVVTLVGALVILRHQKNIQRLLSGTENRFSTKK
jgi:glycerol-3-phosphate acyltransferase PlsY